MEVATLSNTLSKLLTDDADREIPEFAALETIAETSSTATMDASDDSSNVFCVIASRVEVQDATVKESAFCKFTNDAKEVSIC
jgi:hypothetical protein